MQRNKILKYILDIESVIQEIESVEVQYMNSFKEFSENFMAIRTVERDLQIIGEAVKKMKEIDPNINFTNINHIIRLRDLLAHQYDIIDPAILWGIIKKDLPILKSELSGLKS